MTIYHKHHWKTRYVVRENISIVTGMQCTCGAILYQGQIEDALNNFDLSEIDLLRLQPCPFCGGTEAVKVSQNIQDDSWYVYCQTCGGRSGPCGQKFHAINSWNNRVDRAIE